MKLDKVLCCMFLFSFFGRDHAHVLSTEELTNRNVLVT